MTDNSTNASFYPIFVSTLGSAADATASSTKLSFNPSTGVLGTIASTAQYADLAELYSADANYEPGTVVSIGGSAEITVSDIANDKLVAGVVSTNPSYTMNTALIAQYPVAVALQGRLPCKVQGTIKRGDLLVSAGQGRAKASANPGVGEVIRKALENFDGEVGVIEIMIGKH